MKFILSSFQYPHPTHPWGHCNCPPNLWNIRKSDSFNYDENSLNHKLTRNWFTDASHDDARSLFETFGCINLKTRDLFVNLSCLTEVSLLEVDPSNHSQHVRRDFWRTHRCLAWNWCNDSWEISAFARRKFRKFWWFYASQRLLDIISPRRPTRRRCCMRLKCDKELSSVSGQVRTPWLLEFLSCLWEPHISKYRRIWLLLPNDKLSKPFPFSCYHRGIIRGQFGQHLRGWERVFGRNLDPFFWVYQTSDCLWFVPTFRGSIFLWLAGAAGKFCWFSDMIAKVFQLKLCRENRSRLWWKLLGSQKILVSMESLSVDDFPWNFCRWIPHTWESDGTDLLGTSTLRLLTEHLKIGLIRKMLC